MSQEGKLGHTDKERKDYCRKITSRRDSEIPEKIRQLVTRGKNLKMHLSKITKEPVVADAVNTGSGPLAGQGLMGLEV